MVTEYVEAYQIDVSGFHSHICDSPKPPQWSTTRSYILASERPHPGKEIKAYFYFTLFRPNSYKENEIVKIPSNYGKVSNVSISKIEGKEFDKFLGLLKVKGVTVEEIKTKKMEQAKIF